MRCAVVVSVSTRRQDFQILESIVQPISVSMMDVAPQRDLNNRIVEHDAVFEHETVAHRERVIR